MKHDEDDDAADDDDDHDDDDNDHDYDESPSVGFFRGKFPQCPWAKPCFLIENRKKWKHINFWWKMLQYQRDQTILLY